MSREHAVQTVTKGSSLLQDRASCICCFNDIPNLSGPFYLNQFISSQFSGLHIGCLQSNFRIAFGLTELMVSAESLKIDPLTQQQQKSFDAQDNDMSSGPSSLGMLYTNSSLEGLQTDEQRLVLDTIAQLRKCGLESVISLPQLVVSGDQSAGKSSVLEALTEIPFPRSDNLCTRHATEIILRPGAVESLAVKVIPDSKRPSHEQDRIKAFTESIMNLDELPDTMAKAMALMGIESDPTSGSNSRVFSRDVLSVEIEGPSRPQLTLVDIPGLIQNETKGATRADVDLVAEMTEHYISQPRTICLAVISATNDYANQGILTKVRKVDPDGDRTLGIITKPDRLEAGSGMEQAFIGLTRNQDIFLKLGWHVLKNRSFDEGKNSFVERNLSEKTYFHKSNFKVLPQDCVGIDSLRDRLSKLLFNHVKQELPKLREDLETALSDSRTQLETMGNPRATLQDCRDYLTSLSLDYYEICKAAVNGHYEGLYFTSGVDGVFSIASPAIIRRLRAAIQHMNAEFSNSIRTIGHKYQINRSSDAKINKLNSFAASEEEEEPILPDIKPGSPTRMSHAQALSWVSQALTRTRGKELSGNFNPLLVGELFWEQSSNWCQLATEHVEHVGHICSRFLEALLHDKCPKDIQSRLWSSQIQDTIKSRNEASICELKLIIEDLRSYPMNYDHYYTDTIEKQRREREEKDLAKCIEAATKRTKLDGCHSSHTSASIDIKHVVKEHSQHTDPDMERYACEQALDCLFAIYKVCQHCETNCESPLSNDHPHPGLAEDFHCKHNNPSC